MYNTMIEWMKRDSDNPLSLEEQEVVYRMSVILQEKISKIENEYTQGKCTWAEHCSVKSALEILKS